MLLRVELAESRFRWILHCRAATDVLKTHADSESNGARWVTLQECAAIESGQMQGVENCWLRGEEPIKWFEYISAGYPSFSLSEFVQAISEKGAECHGSRAAYRTSSDGRIAVLRQSSGLVAAFCDASGMFCNSSSGFFISRNSFCRNLPESAKSPLLITILFRPIPIAVDGVRPSRCNTGAFDAK